MLGDWRGRPLSPVLSERRQWGRKAAKFEALVVFKAARRLYQRSDLSDEPSACPAEFACSVEV